MPKNYSRPNVLGTIIIVLALLVIALHSFLVMLSEVLIHPLLMRATRRVYKFGLNESQRAALDEVTNHARAARRHRYEVIASLRRAPDGQPTDVSSTVKMLEEDKEMLSYCHVASVLGCREWRLLNAARV